MAVTTEQPRGHRVPEYQAWVEAQNLPIHHGYFVGDFKLAEVGPWQVRDGTTVITRETIALTAQTELAIAFRAEDAGDGFAGEFVEAPLGRAGVYVDDYVTIECRHEGARMVALKITVTDLPGGTFTKEDAR